MKRYLILGLVALLLVGTVSAACDTIIEINATDDGYVYGQISYPGGSLSAIRATSGTWGSTSSSVYAMLLAHNNTGNYSRLYRVPYIFNTSIIPDGSVICNATISAATYSATSQFIDLGLPTYGITGYDSTAATIGIYDFDKRLDTLFSDNFTPAAATVRNNWSLNAAGVASINRTGLSHFMMRNSWDIFNETTNLTWADSANTTFRVYSLEDGAATGRQPVMRIAYNSSVETLWNATWNQNGTDTLPLLPANHIARYNISELPVHSSSTGWINAINTHGTGGGIFKVYMGTTGSNIGKKIMYVGTGVRTTAPLFDRVLSQSDVGGTFDWPNNPWWDAASGDGNMYVFNRDTRLGYEFSYVDDTDHPGGVYPNGTNAAGTGNIYNYTNLSVHRPLGTSAGSVSGMQRIPLLLTYADINSTAITHGFEASWYTTNSVSSSDYLWPASATTTYAPNASFPTMGARFRLKNSTDLSHLQSSHPQAYKVALALRDYGAFLNIRSGTEGLRINGEADVLSSTDNSALQTACPVTAFEFVDESGLMVSASSYEAGTGLAPVAAYHANATTGGSPLAVQFTDESTNSPTDWDWYWYEVDTPNYTKKSDLQNPTVSLTTGTYNVQLYAANSHGGDWFNITEYITVFDSPVADFSASATTGPAPLSVTFSDLSSSAYMWDWDFNNDGTVDSTSQNPTHIYSTIGLYTVNLTAYNSVGSDSEVKVAYINVTTPVPVAAFSANRTTGNAPMAVGFTDSSTNTPTSWAWTFGDGSTSTDQNPSHEYTTLGNFTVTLTATNAGGSDVESKSGYISVVAFPIITPTPTPAPTSGPGSHPRSMAVTTLATIPGERYDALTRVLGFSAVEGTMTPNWSGAPPEIVGVYTDYMGPIAFLLIFLIPFGMIWLSHGNMKLLAVLGFITGLFVSQYLPANYWAAAVICMGVSVAAGIWGLFKQ